MKKYHRKKEEANCKREISLSFECFDDLKWHEQEFNYDYFYALNSPYSYDRNKIEQLLETCMIISDALLVTLYSKKL